MPELLKPLNSLAKPLPELKDRLQQAIEGQELRLHYQPIIAMATGQIVGLEALVRWYHPEMGAILPTTFIPIAEETGAIVPMGNWILREACQQLHTWQSQGLVSPQVTMNVNLSSHQLVAWDFLGSIDRILAETGIEATCLNLELTETSHLPLDRETLSLLQELRFRQIQLSLDDFGTGYSSLAYLQCIPAKCLKIDRSFVRCLDSDWKSRAIVQSLVQLAQGLGMSVTAEGIETQEQLAYLQEMGCEYGQGYWFSKPLNREAMAKLLFQMPEVA